MEKGLWDGAYMRILLNGKWHVVLEDGTTGQMDLPGTLDENGIGHRDGGRISGIRMRYWGMRRER